MSAPITALSSSISVALEDKIAAALRGQKNSPNGVRLNVRFWPKADVGVNELR